MGSYDYIKSPFDVINNINEKKGGILPPFVIKKHFDPFLTDKALSFTIDTLSLANEGNKICFLPPELLKEMKYRYYYCTVGQRKRWSKWVKRNEKSKFIVILAEYYEISQREAEMILDVHTDKQLKMIEKATFKGGI